MKIYICLSFVFVLVSRVKGSCNDVCQASMAKSCEDTCRSSCSSRTNLDTSAVTGGTDLSTSTASVGQGSGATGITGGNDYGTSATMLDQSYTSPPPTDTSTPLDQSGLPQPLHQRKVRDLLRSDHVIFSDDDHLEAAPLRQEIVLLDSVDQSNVQVPSISNHLQYSNNDGIFDGQLPINDREYVRQVRDVEGANLPERPDRIIFNAADKDVKLPFRQDVLLSRDQPIKERDEPINKGLPYRSDALLSRDRNSRRVPSRFVRDLNGQLPERSDRVVFGNVGNVQLPMRKDALRSRDLPLPDNNSNGDGVQPQPSVDQSQQNTQSQCEPRCNSACMAQISTVCQQTCSQTS